jgi:hypothetical protein
MGRHYPLGTTEIVSKGLEYFASPAKAEKLFLRDGDYLLKLLGVLQSKPL